jgi:5-methylcytosine-specific restriction endonuclease McrA
MPMGRKAAARARSRLWEIQDGLCAYCDERLTILRGPRLATIDHIIPTCSGGSDDDQNLVLSCWECNRMKGSMSVSRIRKLADRIELYEGSQSQDITKHLAWLPIFGRQRKSAACRDSLANLRTHPHVR